MCSGTNLKRFTLFGAEVLELPDDGNACEPTVQSID